MIKLEEYYRFIDNLALKEALSDEQRALYKGVEEEIILNEVCRDVGELVKDRLSKIRRPVTFVIDYNPTGTISVKAAHNRSTQSFFVTPQEAKIIEASEPMQDEIIEQNTDVQPLEEDIDQIDSIESEHNEMGSTTRGPRKSFKVYLFGKEVKAKDCAGILAESIRRIGFKKVAALNITYVDGEYNLVDKRKRDHKGHVWQRQVGDWYIYTNSTTPEKIRRLREIAERLHIDLVVQEEYTPD